MRRRNEEEKRGQDVQMAEVMLLHVNWLGREKRLQSCMLGAVVWRRGRRRKRRRRRVEPAVVAEPRAHLMQACGFVYTRDSRAYLGACVHGTVMERKLGKELRKCN